jgi:voltage-gated potassium channel
VLADCQDAPEDMMTTAPVPALSAAERRRRLAIGLLRALAITVVLGAAYYLLPLDRLSSVPMWLLLAVGLLALAAVAALQVRAVIRSRHPAVQAVEALAATAPLFLLLFAAAYFLMAQVDPNHFNVETLTRTDSLYFTVTIFATVGFGDITAASGAARILVTTQMILDLIVLGLGIRIFVSAVEVGRQKASDGPQTVASR